MKLARPEPGMLKVGKGEPAADEVDAEPVPDKVLPVVTTMPDSEVEAPEVG